MTSKTIEEGVCESDWTALYDHYLRDALIMVDISLNLVDVGLKVANDQTQIMQDWINKGLIGKPIKSQTETWSMDDQKKFLFVIVQPYVLAQVMEH